MATKVYKPKRKISATESEEIKIPASSVDGLSTVATSGSYNDLSNKPTIPDVSGLMPKSGGTFTGNISVPSTITFTDTTNPYIKMTTGGTAFYFQSTSGQFGLGPTWNKATHWDANGNVTFPTAPKVGSSSLALKSDIPTNYVTTNTAQDITAEKKFLNTLIVGAKDDGSTGFKVIQGDIAGGDTLFTVSVNGIDLDAHEHNIPLLIGGNAGTSGQVLTSQGAGNAPIWTTPTKGTVTQVKINGATKSPDSAGLVDLGTVGGSSDNSKHGYTQLTNENLNTITEAGWYRAASGNTCTNRPSAISATIPFVLEVEKSTDAYIKQTMYQTGNAADTYFVTYVRYSSNSGSSWISWMKQQTIADGYGQMFSGRKSFLTGINISHAPLEFNTSSGSNGQFAMSQGSSSAPKWVNLQVKVNGTTYTADSSGLIDLGTISGGGSVAYPFNDIY